MKQAILYGARYPRIEDNSLDCENPQPDQICAETVVCALSTTTGLATDIVRRNVRAASPHFHAQSHQHGNALGPAFLYLETNGLPATK